MALSNLSWSTVLCSGLLVLLALGFVAFIIDLRAAYQSTDAAEHTAAASTIGQLITVGVALTSIATVFAIWRGAVPAAVAGACLFWLVGAAAARFSRSSQAWTLQHPALDD